MRSVLELIHQPLRRTEEQILHAFDTLFKRDYTISRFFKYEQVEDFDKILDNLKLVSKTRLMNSRYCPFQFKCKYVLKLAQTSKPRAMVDGKNLHWVCDQLWSRLTVDDFLKTDLFGKHIYRKFIDLIPFNERTEKIIKMAKNVTHFEIQRINGIFSDVGKTREAIERYVFPIINEVAIENWDRNMMGIIDRIDRTTNEAFVAFERKFGKPKLFQNSSNKTNILTELGFYGLLPQGDEVWVINNETGYEDDNYCIPYDDYFEKLTGETEKVRFYYGAMVFYEDWKNTGKLIKLNKRTLVETEKKINHYWNMINNGLFTPKPNNACQQWCDYYWDFCEHNPEWQEIEKIME